MLDGLLDDWIRGSSSTCAGVSTSGGGGSGKVLTEASKICVGDFSSLIGREVPAHFVAGVSGDLSALGKIAIGSGGGSIATIGSQSSGIGAGGLGGALDDPLSPLRSLFCLNACKSLLCRGCCLRGRGRVVVAVGEAHGVLGGCLVLRG